MNLLNFLARYEAKAIAVGEDWGHTTPKAPSDTHELLRAVYDVRIFLSRRLPSEYNKT